jgi:hypothetical protein
MIEVITCFTVILLCQNFPRPHVPDATKALCSDSSTLDWTTLWTITSHIYQYLFVYNRVCSANDLVVLYVTLVYINGIYRVEQRKRIFFGETV